LWFQGRQDEISVDAASRSPGWITTDYNTQNSPSTFLTAGSPTPSAVAYIIPARTIIIF